MKDADKAPSGIILFAKQPGKTSFSSLFTVKHALNTKKVGHTGTLDSFAQGLLVVLSGSLTRLVPHITAFDKTYEAIISFGTETDTLDPTGDVIKTAPLPHISLLTETVARFRGELEQKPPLYSAVHVDGKRASDIARKGTDFEIPSRTITVYDSEIIELQNEDGERIPLFDLSAAGELVAYAHIRFKVSKGTYIRSLARDIAAACGSAGHLAGLLRTEVGSFSLADAAGADMLRPFTIANVLSENREISDRQKKKKEKSNVPDALENPEKAAEIERERILENDVRIKMKQMSPGTAAECGLTPVVLKSEYEKVYFNGQPLRNHMFENIRDNVNDISEFAVFTDSDEFAGVISMHGKRISYQYVVPKDNPGKKAGRKANDLYEDKMTSCTGRSDPLRVFSWEDIVSACNDSESEIRAYFKDGSALSVGGFDGPHAGHLKLFDAVIDFAEKKRKEGRLIRKGIVTFRQPPHSVCSPNLFSGDISTLQLKLDLFTVKGFDFAIVIDFSSDFSRMKGNDFLSILKDCCSMQFAAAGVDFRCGYQLDTGVAELSAFARQNDFQFQVIDDVTRNGTRISSSLIRTCIQEGRLQEAEMLLGRPYTVDLRNVTGKIRNELHCLLQIAHGDVLQILPPDGDYTVKVTSSGARTCDTVLHVDSSLLRLEIPPEWSTAGIEKIEFTTLVS